MSVWILSKQVPIREKTNLNTVGHTSVQYCKTSGSCLRSELFKLKATPFSILNIHPVVSGFLH